MELTPYQRNVLRIYLRYKEADFSFGNFVGSIWWRWCLFAAFAVGGYYFLASFAPGAAWLIVGMMVGAALRDVSYFIGALRMWPVNRETYDWERIEELVGGKGDGDAGDAG